MKEKWLKVHLYSEVNKPKISRLIQIESELTYAVMQGHKSFWGDEYKDMRLEALRLRTEILNQVQ